MGFWVMFKGLLKFSLLVGDFSDLMLIGRLFFLRCMMVIFFDE